MTLLRALSLTATLAIVSGCASFSPYSVSESTLEGYLHDAVNRFDEHQAGANSPLNASLTSADITLGPDGRNVAILDIAGQVSVDAFVARLPVDIALEVEGAPYYDSSERAVYIRDLKLLKSDIQSAFFNGDIAPVSDTMMSFVAQWLETVPVYRLDDTNLGERLLGMVPSDVRVAPGRLEFVMGNGEP
ncbi:hypothetical protein CF392_01505 [Tamilnaduibacter salinus]|nr:hypothetical protein CF392_01505 [Tamilnaduibacter salinus]